MCIRDRAHPFNVSEKRLLIVLALLVGNRAGSLAGRLAGSLALAAAAMGSAVLQGGTIQGLNMLQRNPLLI